MAKATKLVYLCQSCGAKSLQWSGQCADCGAWNSLIEELPIARNASRREGGYAGIQSIAKIAKLSQVAFEEIPRFSSGLSELDRVLGGGIVPGSVVLIGGDPGVGKSTLLLQTFAELSSQHSILYVTGEESLEQIALRAQRLNLPLDGLELLLETQIEQILAQTNERKPKILALDSIQTIYTDLLSSAPGSVGQLRESTAQCVRFAKQTNTAMFIIGHVTKEGMIAGPRVLEHMVDTVLYFEGEPNNRLRLIRAVKNRFGAVNELGVFAMTEKGLREVTNPSAIFLSRYADPIPGSVVMAGWEGSRPLLLEVQALVDNSHLANPRRLTVGLESGRLAMLLAILHRHAGVATYDQDVFVNAVGGVRITETAADLAILLAILSSLKNKPFPHDMIVFGEVGLAGEIRPVPNGQERLKEAAKQGFKRAMVPKGNLPKIKIGEMEIIAVERVSEVTRDAGG